MALNPPPVDPDGRQISGDGEKTARLPRWTRHEILVLIQGKRVAESRVRKTRASGSGQMEPKWASVSSYCSKHGVNRGPVQCRKRWSNLAGDFKKIKEWESRVGDESTESFWVMRNDLRRERKLPGFFDREVYDILDGGGGEEVVGGGGGLELALAPSGGVEGVATEEEVVADEALAPISVAEKQHQSIPQESPNQGVNPEKQAASESNIRSSQEGKKRKRSATNGDGDDGETTTSLQHRLIEALEKNGKLLSSQLEAQNANIQLDREQREGHMNSIITVLDKLADALGRIADKL